MTPEEYYGGSVYDIAGNDVTMRFNQRYAFIDPAGPSQFCQLPDARTLKIGDAIKITNRGTNPSLFAIDVRDDTGASIFSLPAGATVRFNLFENDDAAGSWTNRVTGNTIGIGSPIPFSRDSYTVVIDEPLAFLNLRTHLIATTAYTGSEVVKVNCFIRADLFGVPGVQNGGTGINSFDTGAFPFGSTIYVEVAHNFEVAGGGGNGGDGGDESTATAPGNGGNGGFAMLIDTQTTLRVHGRVSAGAGGGGGGDYHDTGNADGGGGGGGSPNGVGGAAGGSAANAGGTGTADKGGSGGLATTAASATPGGAGGGRAQPGTAGAASGDGAGASTGGLPHADAIRITARPGASLQILSGDGLINGNVTQL